MGDIGFSGAQLALLAAIATPLLTAIGVLFRALLASKDSQIAYLTQQLDEAQARLNRGIPALDEAETITRERAREKRR